MKKVFLAVLCAGLFFACGNKKQQEPEALLDTVPVEEVVQEVAEEVVEEPVAEEPVAQAAPAKKPAAAPKKTTNNNSGMTAAKTTDAAPTVEEHAKSAANKIGNKAIDKAEQEATTTIVNSGKKKR